jgi:hypothetical protein
LTEESPPTQSIQQKTEQDSTSAGHKHAAACCDTTFHGVPRVFDPHILAGPSDDGLADQQGGEKLTGGAKPFSWVMTKAQHGSFEKVPSTQ